MEWHFGCVHYCADFYRSKYNRCILFKNILFQCRICRYLKFWTFCEILNASFLSLLPLTTFCYDIKDLLNILEWLVQFSCIFSHFRCWSGLSLHTGRLLWWSRQMWYILSVRRFRTKSLSAVPVRLPSWDGFFERAEHLCLSCRFWSSRMYRSVKWSW